MSANGTLQPHQQRVVDERNELEKKWSALGVFTNGGEGSIFAGLDEAEQTRLVCQYRFMGGYLDMLNSRIDAFGASA